VTSADENAESSDDHDSQRGLIDRHSPQPDTDTDSQAKHEVLADAQLTRQAPVAAATLTDDRESSPDLNTNAACSPAADSTSWDGSQPTVGTSPPPLPSPPSVTTAVSVIDDDDDDATAALVITDVAKYVSKTDNLIRD